MDQWTAADFDQCAPELIELIEGWRIEVHTKRAAEGKLPRVVVKEVAENAAFPTNAKRSLSRTSPATLADIFNALNVPVKLKKYVVTTPLVLYLCVRDIAGLHRIDSIIAEQEEKRRASENQTPAPLAP